MGMGKNITIELSKEEIHLVIECLQNFVDEGVASDEIDAILRKLKEVSG